MNDDAPTSVITGDVFTLISNLTRFCGGRHFSFLVFMHAFMAYKVRRIVVGLNATKKARKRSARKLRAVFFREEHPIDKSGVASVCFDITNVFIR